MPTYQIAPEEQKRVRASKYWEQAVIHGGVRNDLFLKTIGTLTPLSADCGVPDRDGARCDEISARKAYCFRVCSPLASHQAPLVIILCVI